VVAPVRITVPRNGIDMRVTPVGVAPDGRMALPSNPAVAGWYRFGPDARAAHGSVVLAAHVDSLRYGLGPFVHLRDLPKNTLIRIRDADGRTTRYRVDRVRHVRKADLREAGVFDRHGDRRLTLVTCGGTFDTRTRTYSDNVIVTARAVVR
jgi:sortase (surface protein transpeptidase)